MNKFFLVLIGLISFSFILGCIGENTPVTPIFTLGQLINKVYESDGVTKATYAKFVNGDYNGLCFGQIDVNNFKLFDCNVSGGVPGGDTNWSDLTGLPLGCPDGMAVQVLDDTLTCISVGGNYGDANVLVVINNLDLNNSLDYLKSGDNVSELVNDAGYLTSAVDTNWETSWSKLDANLKNYFLPASKVSYGSLSEVQSVSLSSTTLQPHGVAQKGDVVFISGIEGNRLFRLNNPDTNLSDYDSVYSAASSPAIIYDSVNDVVWGVYKRTYSAYNKLYTVNPDTLAITEVHDYGLGNNAFSNATITQDANYVYIASPSTDLYRTSKVDYNTDTLSISYGAHSSTYIPELGLLAFANAGGFSLVYDSNFTLFWEGTHNLGTTTDDMTYVVDNSAVYLVLGSESYDLFGKIKIGEKVGGSYVPVVPVETDLSGDHSYGCFVGGSLGYNTVFGVNGSYTAKPVYCVLDTNLSVLYFAPNGDYETYSLTLPTTSGSANEFFQLSTGQKFYTTYDLGANHFHVVEVSFDEWALPSTYVVVNPIDFTRDVNAVNINASCLRLSDGNVFCGKVDMSGSVDLSGYVTQVDANNWFVKNSDLNGIIDARERDTNWATDWSTFDANMKNTYRKYSVDLNTSANVGVDGNVKANCFFMQDGNRICGFSDLNTVIRTYETSSLDTNTFTAGIQRSDNNAFNIDLNVGKTSAFIQAMNTGGNGKTIKILADNSTDASYVKAITGVPASTAYAINCYGSNKWGNAVFNSSSLTAFTADFWFYNPSSTSNFVYGWGSSNLTSIYWLIAKDGWGSITLYAEGAYRISGMTVGQDTWNHVVVTADGNTWKVYVNNSAPYTWSGGITAKTNGGYVVFNTHSTYYGAYYFDEAKIFNYVYDATKVANSYNGGNGTYGYQSESGLLAGWHFDEGTGSTGADYSGNGHTASFYNTPSWISGKVASGNSDAEVQVIKISDGVSAGANGTLEFGNSTANTVINGGTTSFQNASTTKGSMSSTGLTWINSYKTWWGNSSNASAYYDGTNFFLNPKEVGTGKLTILGDVNIHSGRLDMNNKANVFVGHLTGDGITTGSGNVGLGVEACDALTTQSSNICVGYQAGKALAGSGTASVTGAIAIGYQALKTMSAQTAGAANKPIAIGYQALTAATTPASSGGNIAIGTNCLDAVTTGYSNVVIGTDAGGAFTTGFGNVLIGTNALEQATLNSYGNTAIGSYAMSNSGAVAVVDNICVGYSCLKKVTGQQNTAIAYNSATQNTFSGYRNVFAGYESGFRVRGAFDNVFDGANTGYSCTDCNNNVFSGSSAGYTQSTGANNVKIGYTAGYTGATDTNNVMVGSESGYLTTGNNNTFLGTGTGRNTSSGANNVFIGQMAGYSNTTRSGSVMIGYQAGMNSNTANRLYIANDSRSNPLIYGEFDNNILTINGSLGIGTTTPQNKLNVVGDLNVYGGQIYDSNLTSGRVPFITTNGRLTDSNNLTFDGNTFKVTGDINATTKFNVGLSAGITRNTRIVKDVNVDGTFYCDLNFVGGILTGSDC